MAIFVFDMQTFFNSFLAWSYIGSREHEKNLSPRFALSLSDSLPATIKA